jgi:hypothetical protein
MPDLPQEKLMEVFKAAVRISDGDPALLAVQYDVKTSRQDCDYLVSAVSRTTTSHYSVVIDRSGRIKSWPWCCEPSFFVSPKPGISEAQHGACGPELSEDQILHIAEEAIRASGQAPSLLEKYYRITIEADACDYSFMALPVGLEAREPILIRIDRSGKVKSFPWCCPLGSCPDLCTPMSLANP